MQVHRDIAARNILVSADYTFKVGDFGLGRHLKQDGTAQEDADAYYRASGAEALPVRWTAPEALAQHEYTTGQ